MVQPYTVLIVEQMDSVRRATKRVLSLRGYRVLEAADANQALVLLACREGHVDLVLIGVVGGLARGRRRLNGPGATRAPEYPLETNRVGPESPTRSITLFP